MKHFFTTLLLAGLLTGLFAASSPAFAQTGHAANDLRRAEQNLRISQEALRGIQRDIATLQQRGGAASDVRALQQYAERQKRTVAFNQQKVDALRAQVPAPPPPKPVAPEYQVARPAPDWKSTADEDPLAAFDRELRKSVSTFDAKLLRELDRIAQARESGAAGAGAVASTGAHSEQGGGGGGQSGGGGGGGEGQQGSAGGPSGQQGQAGGQQGQGGQSGQGQTAGGGQQGQGRQGQGGQGQQAGQPGGQGGPFGQQGQGQPGGPQGQGQGQGRPGQGAGQVAGGPGQGQGQHGNAQGTGRGQGQPGGAIGAGSGIGNGEEGAPSRTTRPGKETDDIVARQLREAAEAEKDPALREKLWAEYEKYKGR